MINMPCCLAVRCVGGKSKTTSSAAGCKSSDMLFHPSSPSPSLSSSSSSSSFPSSSSSYMSFLVFVFSPHLLLQGVQSERSFVLLLRAILLGGRESPINVSSTTGVSLSYHIYHLSFTPSPRVPSSPSCSFILFLLAPCLLLVSLPHSLAAHFSFILPDFLVLFFPSAATPGHATNASLRSEPTHHSPPHPPCFR